MGDFLNSIDKTRKAAIHEYVEKAKELLRAEIQKDPSLLEISIDANLPSLETASIVCAILNKEGIITRVSTSFGARPSGYFYSFSYIHYLYCTVRGVNYNKFLKNSAHYQQENESDSEEEAE